jgi:PadR family transcriptional regulator PadR
MEIETWQSQLRRGTAELVILALLRGGEQYGLGILERVNRHGEMVADGALYPLLNRLEKAGRIAARWSIGEGSANPRKYYSLTKDGREMAQAMLAHWQDHSASIERLLQEKEEDR